MMGGFAFMIVFWVLLIIGVVMLVRWWANQKSNGPRSARDGKTAIQVLKERFARGEIDRDEFLAKRKDLE